MNPANPSVVADPLSALVASHDDVPRPATIPTDAFHDVGTCVICGLGGPGYRPDAVFSDAFTASDRFGAGSAVCFRCRYMAETTDYRRYHWIATASDGIQITKDRPDLVETLLDPPEEPWMLHYATGFLRILNGWALPAIQRLNTSREDYHILVDKQVVDLNRETVAGMVEFGRDLRERGVTKGVLKEGVANNLWAIEKYGISRIERERLDGPGRSDDGLVGRPDWNLVANLID